jgi:hypothetical protein
VPRWQGVSYTISRRRPGTPRVNRLLHIFLSLCKEIVYMLLLLKRLSGVLSARYYLWHVKDAMPDLSTDTA